jgi:hypothetical protein
MATTSVVAPRIGQPSRYLNSLESVYVSLAALLREEVGETNLSSINLLFGYGLSTLAIREKVLNFAA